MSRYDTNHDFLDDDSAIWTKPPRGAKPVHLVKHCPTVAPEVVQDAHQHAYRRGLRVGWTGAREACPYATAVLQYWFYQGAAAGAVQREVRKYSTPEAERGIRGLFRFCQRCARRGR